MRSLAATVVSVAVLFCLAMPVQADITNGGFEAGLTGWSSAGTVSATTFEMARDLVPTPDWLPTQGSYFASLWSTDSAGSNASAMSQTFFANAGDVLSFDSFFDFGDFAPPLGAYDTAQAVVAWDGVAPRVFEFNTPGHELGDFANVGWNSYSFVLPETGGYTLTFSIADGNGVFESILGVDNVKVTAVPAPGAILLGAIGLSLVGAVRKRFA